MNQNDAKFTKINEFFQNCLNPINLMKQNDPLFTKVN